MNFIRTISACFIFALPSLLPSFLGAQEKNEGTATMINVSRPKDLFLEWWLQLRNGDVIIADRANISLGNKELVINGTLRELHVPLVDIRGLSEIPARKNFRNALLGSLFLTSLIAYSPENTSGYYIGRVKGNSNNEAVFPGLSAFSILISAAASVGVALVANTFQEHILTTTFDGSESERAWRTMLDDSFSRWHLRGIAAFVQSSGQDNWHKAHSKYGFEDSHVVQQYYSSIARPAMTDLNLGRMLALSYSIDPQIEVGLAVQSDGIQRFYEQFSYVVAGTPPTSVTRELSNQSNSTMVLLTGRYTIFPLTPGHLSVSVGAGVGYSGVSADVAGYGQEQYYYQQVDETRIAERDQLGFMLFTSCEYAFDRTFSLGLHMDYSMPGKVTIPEQEVKDYQDRSYRIIAPFDLSLNSIGAGLSLGFHF